MRARRAFGGLTNLSLFDWPVHLRPSSPCNSSYAMLYCLGPALLARHAYDLQDVVGRNTCYTRPVGESNIFSRPTLLCSRLVIAAAIYPVLLHG